MPSTFVEFMEQLSKSSVKWQDYLIRLDGVLNNSKLITIECKCMWVERSGCF